MLIYSKNYGNNSHCRISLLFPVFEWDNKNDNLFGKGIATKQISFPTKICLTSSKFYINITVCILGFGIGLQIKE